VVKIHLSGCELNVHFHMLFLDGVYVERPDGSLRFRWVKAPTSAELTGLVQALARRIGRFLERGERWSVTPTTAWMQEVGQRTEQLPTTAWMQEVGQRTEQLPTTAWMQEVGQRTEQLPRTAT